MKNILERIRREPALVIGLVSAVIALLLAFGFSLTDEQVGAIMSVVVAVLAVVTRQAVTPNISVAAKEAAARASALVAGPAARVPDGEPVEVVRAAPDSALSFTGRHRERGAFDTGILLALACIVVILVGVVWLAQAL